MPSVSPAQHRLMECAAHSPGGCGGVPQSVGKEFAGKDAILKAAGTIFVTPKGTVLWLKKPPKGDFLGEWVFPGGKIDAGETAAQAATREAGEELGYVPEGDPIQLHRGITDRGVDYTTFLRVVPAEFQAALNDEHIAWAWAPLDDPPAPTHPGILSLLDDVKAAGVAVDAAAALVTAPSGGIPAAAGAKRQAQDMFALDASPGNRTRDPLDGHLRVASSVVSSAQVNDYACEEIPGWNPETKSHALGLIPGRIYALLRDPAEMEKGAATLHGKPLVVVHRAQTASDHDRTITVGTVTNPVWKNPNLEAELTIWDGEAIALVESDEQSDLSAGYGYRPEMTPGTFNGVAYEGVMRDISFNHLALVSQGRVIGAFVGDSAHQQEIKQMSKVLLSRKAAVAKGAIMAILRPSLAQDAKLDLNPLFADLTSKNFAAKKAGLLASVAKIAAPKLAKDAKMEMDAMKEAMDAAEKEEVAEDEKDDLPEPGKGKDKMGKDDAREFLKGKLSEDDMEAYDAMCAEDEDDETEEEERKKLTAKDKGAKDKMGKDKGGKDEKDDEEKVSKQAMDSALRKNSADTEAAMFKRLAGIREAEALCRPLIGEISLALDSAEKIYRATLEAKGEDHKGVDASALPALVKMLARVEGEGRKAPAPHLAKDAAPLSALAEFQKANGLPAMKVRNLGAA